MTYPSDNEAAFQEAVRRHWDYHAPCEQVFWRSEVQGDGTLKIDLAPVYQEVFGGEDDGKRVWAGFELDLLGLCKELGIIVKDCGAMSRCEEYNPTPFVGVNGEYFGQPFRLRIHLEPMQDSEIREVKDTLRLELRAVNPGTPEVARKRVKIRFTQEITLLCVEMFSGEFEGEECTLDFPAGKELDNVKIDNETLFDVRVWLRDDLVALAVQWEWFEIIE
jgi:hypothetical protein